jgi:hypothetical protein
LLARISRYLKAVRGVTCPEQRAERVTLVIGEFAKASGSVCAYLATPCVTKTSARLLDFGTSGSARSDHT